METSQYGLCSKPIFAQIDWYYSSKCIKHQMCNSMLYRNCQVASEFLVDTISKFSLMAIFHTRCPQSSNTFTFVDYKKQRVSFKTIVEISRLWQSPSNGLGYEYVNLHMLDIVNGPYWTLWRLYETENWYTIGVDEGLWYNKRQAIIKVKNPSYDKYYAP